MNLTIIPGVLDTDTVCKVPTEVINMLPYISTDAIVSVINNFTKNNSSSKDVNVLNAVNKLRAAYRSVNELEELLNDTKSKNDIEVLANLDYISIDLRSCSMTELQLYRNLINEYVVSRGENDIQDFIPKKDLVNLENTLDEMRAYQDEWPAVELLIKNIYKYKQIFKDGQWTNNRRTIYAKIYKKRVMLKNILRGIDFLLDRTEKGVSPSTWRIL